MELLSQQAAQLDAEQQEASAKMMQTLLEQDQV